MIDTEFWVPIHGFPVYSVSNHGNVKNVVTDKTVALCKHNHGYFKVHLRNESGESYLYVHRLVLQHFVNNPDGKPQADHVNGDPSNNHVSNLRWATSQENAYNRKTVGGKKDSLPKGVSRVKDKFRAAIKVGNKRTSLGVFPTAEQAGEAYRLRAEQVQGGYAVSVSREPNFVVGF